MFLIFNLALFTKQKREDVGGLMEFSYLCSIWRDVFTGLAPGPAPELQTLKNSKKMAYKISDSCVAGGSCIDECPVGAISAGDIYSIDPDQCTDCGTCASVCPNEAIAPAE